jgi:GIY-YIG catalytic domain
MVFRLFKIPLSQENFDKEWTFIKETARLNDFKDTMVERIFRKQQRKSSMTDFTSLGNALKEPEDNSKFIGIPFYGSLTEKLRRKLKRRNIKIGFQNPGKLSDLLGSTKDKEKDQKKKSGIYMLECEDCDSKYIGMTKRRLEKRQSEHAADCSKPLNQESAMAYHCITENHSMKNEIKLLKQVDEP